MPGSEAPSLLIEFARRMSASDLSPGRSGNLSVRSDEGLLITPSAMEYGDMNEEDLVELQLDGGKLRGDRKPSSEWRFHTAIYENFPAANAVVHCHSRFATTLACLGRSIPAFHYMVAMAGGKSIRCAPYATFGTEALADLAVESLADRKACLLGNHGQLAWHTSLARAYELAEEVESLSAMYCAAASGLTASDRACGPNRAPTSSTKRSTVVTSCSFCERASGEVAAIRISRPLICGISIRPRFFRIKITRCNRG